MTTHSPQVIGEVARESVISLRDFRVVSTPPTFGKDVNALLETVMGASRRDEAIQMKLDEISDLIQADDLAARALASTNSRHCLGAMTQIWPAAGLQSTSSRSNETDSEEE
ncbi:MAG: hypothetical protein R3F65_20545 [bacterium]